MAAGTEDQASTISSSAAVAPTKLGKWTLEFTASDGCTNVSANVTARVICPAASSPLPPMPTSQVYTKYVGDFLLGGRGIHREVELAFPINVTYDEFGIPSVSDVPALLSWTLKSRECPESTVGFESSPGPSDGAKPFGVDLTSRHSKSGGQCLLDRPSAVGRLSSALNSTLKMPGVGRYTVVQSAWDGCRAVDREVTFEVRCNPTPVPAVNVVLSDQDVSLETPGVQRVRDAQSSSVIEMVDDGSEDGVYTYRVTVAASQRAGAVIMPEITINASMSFDAADPKNET